MLVFKNQHKMRMIIVLICFLLQLQDVLAREICSLPPEPGPCKAAVLRYYFNKSTLRCETLTYSGCGGNANNFKTKEECEKVCQQGSNPKK